jgi:plastocyanin
MKIAKRSILSLLAGGALLLTACQPVRFANDTPSASPTPLPVSPTASVLATARPASPTLSALPATGATQDPTVSVDASPTPTRVPDPTATITAAPTETPAGQTAAVQIGNGAFSPRELRVPAGTTVTWIPDSTLPHTVTADSGAFNSGTLQNGDTFQHTFSEAGTYAYYCALHGGPGGAGMSGTIIVGEAEANGGDTSVSPASGQPGETYEPDYP